MEAIWEADSYVPEHTLVIPTSLGGVTDPHAKELSGIGTPGEALWLVSGGDLQAEITGLNEFDMGAPPVAIAFWSFRLIVTAGFWFTLLAFWAGYRWWISELYEDDLLHKVFAGPSFLGIFVVEAGWIVTEVGRQPQIIQGVFRMSEGASPGPTSFETTLTLAGSAIMYTDLFALYTYVIHRAIREGPPSVDETETGVEAAVSMGATGDD